MLLHILLVIHIIVCVFLIGFVLMQQSEGGALGMGGGPSGFMTARGAGNFMTRVTWILFAAFLVLSIVLTLLAGRERAAASVLGRGGLVEKLDPNALNRPAAPAPSTIPVTPDSSVPAPLTAPTPQVRQPLGGSVAPGSAGEAALGGALPAQPAAPAQK